MAESSNLDESKGALSRSLAILGLFVHHPRWSSSDIAREINLSRSTTYRLVNTLCDYGLLERVNGGRQLALGFRAAEIGMAAIAHLDVAQAAREPMQRVAHQTGETVFLAVMSRGEMVYVHREMGWHAVAHSSDIGRRNPVHSTSMGKAYLSRLQDAELQAFVSQLTMIKQTPSITSVSQLLEDVAATRVRGYAIDRCENVDGVACCGASIVDHLGRPVASLSIAGPAERVLASLDTIGATAMQAAAEVSKVLGHAAL